MCTTSIIGYKETHGREWRDIQPPLCRLSRILHGPLGQLKHQEDHQKWLGIGHEDGSKTFCIYDRCQ